jgi:hypothetical protein
MRRSYSRILCRYLSGVNMDKSHQQPVEQAGRTAAHGRGFSKSIAELALLLELTEQSGAAHPVDVAAAEFAADRNIPNSTLRRCASEARALVDHAHASDAVAGIIARADGAEWRLQEEISAWIDETSLPAVLKERALRLNRSRGGRPSSQTRTLRAVEALLEFARAGRTDAMDELRSIRALIEDREPRPTNS